MERQVKKNSSGDRQRKDADLDQPRVCTSCNFPQVSWVHSGLHGRGYCSGPFPCTQLVKTLTHWVSHFSPVFWFPGLCVSGSWLTPAGDQICVGKEASTEGSQMQRDGESKFTVALKTTMLSNIVMLTVHWFETHILAIYMFAIHF